VVQAAATARPLAFTSFADCGALLAWTKARLLERVTAYGLEQPGEYPGPYPPNELGLAGAPATTAAAAPGTVAAPAVPAPAGSASGDTSTTNTQELGVDEGDIADTDGRYVYSIIDHHLRSVDLDGERLLFDRQLPQGDHQLVLDGNALLVVTQESNWTTGAPDTIVARYRVSAGVPALAGQTYLEGTTLAVRSIGHTARVALTDSLVDRVPFVRPRTDSDEDEAAALAQNRRVIAELTIDDLLPRAYDGAADGTTGPLRPAIDCSRVGHPDDFSGFGLVWVAAVDLATPSRPPTGAAGVAADGQTVYASADTLYVATQKAPDVTGRTVPVNPQPPRTALHAFALDDPSGARYLASGDVEGTVLNQYSMSEYDGRLRVATTTNAGGFGSSLESGVHIFERKSDALVEVGAVRGLGRQEQIQAVRFLGDRAYVVTFQRTDPLFVLDLSQPTAPRLVGELTIPGFSAYLDPIGNGLLLGVGFATNANGLTTRTQLGLFDVSNPKAPKQLATTPIGQTSEATFDPHAFLWWAKTGQVVVPKELVCTRRKDCTSAVVVRVVGRTLKEQGRLFHWYPIRRSMVAGGRLVTVSAGGVRENNLATLADEGWIDFGLPTGRGLTSG
jgi:hypothetical protein